MLKQADGLFEMIGESRRFSGFWLLTLGYIKYNFDVLERDYLPEEKDLRREESPER